MKRLGLVRTYHASFSLMTLLLYVCYNTKVLLRKQNYQTIINSVSFKVSVIYKLNYYFYRIVNLLTNITKELCNHLVLST